MTAAEGDDAREAVLRMERKLAEQAAKTKPIDRIVESLRGENEENHYSKRLRDLFREGK